MDLLEENFKCIFCSYISYVHNERMFLYDMKAWMIRKVANLVLEEVVFDGQLILYVSWT